MHIGQNIARLSIGVALIAMTAWFGCAVKTKICTVTPAEVSMGKIRTLAVLKFDGQYGETVRSEFYHKLAEARHFNLIDTSHVNALDRAIYDEVDATRFLPVLEDLHADGVITGRVTANINDIRGTDRVRIQEGTGQYKKEKDFTGQWVDVEITRTVLRPVPYVIRRASLTAEFKVFDLGTKRILAIGKVTEDYYEKFGGAEEFDLRDKSSDSEMIGAMGPAPAGTAGAKAPLKYKLSHLPEPNQILNRLSVKVAARLVAKISPITVTKTVRLDDGGKFGYGGHELIEQGIEFAKKGKWEEAVDIWQDVVKSEPNNAAAYYNMGVAHENVGDLKNLKISRDMYKKAARHGNNSLYIEAITRVKAAISDLQRYEYQRELFKQGPFKQR